MIDYRLSLYGILLLCLRLHLYIHYLVYDPADAGGQLIRFGDSPFVDVVGRFTILKDLFELFVTFMARKEDNRGSADIEGLLHSSEGDGGIDAVQ